MWGRGAAKTGKGEKMKLITLLTGVARVINYNYIRCARFLQVRKRRRSSRVGRVGRATVKEPGGGTGIFLAWDEDYYPMSFMTYGWTDKDSGGNVISAGGRRRRRGKQTRVKDRVSEGRTAYKRGRYSSVEPRGGRGLRSGARRVYASGQREEISAARERKRESDE